MIRYLMRMATSDMTVKTVGSKQAIEGKELAKALERWSTSNTIANAPRVASVATLICLLPSSMLSEVRKASYVKRE